MSQIGLGVLINALGGNKETVECLKASVGRKMTSIALNEDVLFIAIEGENRFKVWDDGQSCCENRYMRTDDDLQDFAGATILDYEVSDAPSQPSEYGDHEVQFFRIHTSKGIITFSSHNEHTGYYGGFSIKAEST